MYGPGTNAYFLEKGQTIEIILNSYDPGKHPFHLHGHNFQAVVRSEPEAGPYANNVTIPEKPMRRDTFQVQPNSNIVIRFKADNPDMFLPLAIYCCSFKLTLAARVWLFHCHIEWHITSGLVATMIEMPAELQASGLTIPQDHLDICRAQGIPTAGNSAGNTQDLFDLTGANEAPGPLPEGFTSRGIAALVMSIVCAFVGLGVITWSVHFCFPVVADPSVLFSTAGHLALHAQDIASSTTTAGFCLAVARNQPHADTVPL